MRRKKHLQVMSRDELIQFGQKLEEQRQRRNARSREHTDSEDGQHLLALACGGIHLLS